MVQYLQHILSVVISTMVNFWVAGISLSWWLMFLCESFRIIFQYLNMLWLKFCFPFKLLTDAIFHKDKDIFCCQPDMIYFWCWVYLSIRFFQRIHSQHFVPPLSNHIVFWDITFSNGSLNLVFNKGIFLFELHRVHRG